MCAGSTVVDDRARKFCIRITKPRPECEVRNARRMKTAPGESHLVVAAAKFSPRARVAEA